MSGFLTLLGWLVLVALGGYFAVAGFGMSILSAGFCGRADRTGIIIGIAGLMIIAVSLLISPIHLTWAAK